MKKNDPKQTTGGICGDNLTWTLDDKGTLTISGSGVMTNWEISLSVPWHNYRSSIKNVVITNGVTSIGDDAFRRCESLTSINIPSSITSIGDGVFFCCGSLNISVDSNNENFCDIDGVLFSKDKTELLAYAKDEIQPDYTIPNSVTSIADHAFYKCKSLTGISIPNSVTSIGDCAFSNCESLKDINMPNSITSIGGWAFAWCGSLKDINIPDSITSIGNFTFYGCESLTSINIPNSVTTIKAWAFLCCKSLTNINIPNSVTIIGSYAFAACGSLNISVDDNNQNFCDIDGILFSKDKTEILAYAKDKIQPDYTIPSSVTKIRDGAFYDCRSLTSINILSGVTSIGDYAFTNCGNLNISVDNNNKNFCDIDGVLFSKDKTEILAYAKDKIQPDYTIPSSVTKIRGGAFYDCSSLTSIDIPNSITSINDAAFGGYVYLTHVYYGGSEAEWKEIKIGVKNEALTDTSIVTTER